MRGRLMRLNHLRRRVVGFDALLILLVAVAVIAADTGGGAWRVAGIRFSIHNPWRPLAWAAVVLLGRVWFCGTIGPFGRRWRAIGQLLGLVDEVRSRPQAPLPDLRELLVVLLALIVTNAVVLHAQVADFYRVPDLGDPLFSMWRMAWVPHQLTTDPWRLFDANIFYPATGTLTYSDSMILPALTAAPLLWAGVHPVVAYNLLLLSGFVLSGLATYVLARCLAFGRPAAWIAALIFCFYPYRLDHYSHLELQMAQWMPIALVAAHRVLSTGRLRYVIYLMLAVAAQWYSSMYYGLFLMVYVAAFAGVLAIAWRPGWRALVVPIGGLVLGLALALPLARAYSASEPVRGTRAVTAVRHFSAKPADYLQPTKRSLLYGTFERQERALERDLFPGVMPLVLAAVGAAPPLTASRLAILVAGLVAFDGSLGLNGHWYPTAYALGGPIKSVRAPARFAIFVGLTLAVLSASGVERLLRRVTVRASRRALVAVFTLAVMADVWPLLELQPVWKTPPSLYASLGPRSGAVLFEYPLHPDPDWFEKNLPYMYFSIWHWTKMVNGYSGFMPPTYRMLAESTAGFPESGTVDSLKGVGVTHVTVHCALLSEGADACRRVTEQLDGDPRFNLVASTQWEGAPSRLYSLAR
jgi:hypothetical protein